MANDEGRDLNDQEEDSVNIAGADGNVEEFEDEEEEEEEEGREKEEEEEGGDREEGRLRRDG
jgi:hypothetical protein